MAVEPLKIEIEGEFRFDDYFRKFAEEDEKAKIKIGLQLINNIVNGSPNESIVPPILEGNLRGSGSVFLGSKLVGFGPEIGNNPTPNQSHSGNDGEITIGFNVSYAARWENNPFMPGTVSQQSGDVGYQYVAKHLNADKEELIELYATFMRKNVK
jgi:hypothetical protein